MARWAAVAAVLTVALSLVASELLVTQARVAAAGDWVEIGIAKDGTKALVDRSSFVETDGRVGLWQRFVLEGAELRPDQPAIVDQLVVYDCELDVVWTLESRELARDGAVSRLDKPSKPEHELLREGTLPALIYEAVC